jgi:hypothetical protein
LWFKGGFLVARALATALLELVDHRIKIGISGAKTSGEPVAAPLHDCLTIGQYFKLASLARCYHGVNAQPLFNQGHETRDLGFIVLSSRAGTYLNVHFVPQAVGYAGFFPVSVISVNQR